MKALAEIELQLSRLGINNRFFGRAEVRELTNVLGHDEVITNAVNGRYEGGFCLLITTNHRLLLVDKKVWFMSIEDIRFDMITEVDYSAQLFDATLCVRTINKLLRVTAIKQKNLRALTSYLQEKLIELRMQGFNHEHAQPAQLIPSAAQSVILPASTIANNATASPTQVPTAIPNRIRRIGAYPTSSLTSQRRFFGQIPRF